MDGTLPPESEGRAPQRMAPHEFPFRSWFEIKPFLSPCSPKGTGYEISVNPATPVDRRGGVLESSDQEATPSPRSRAHNAPDECPANSKMSCIAYAASRSDGGWGH